MRKVIITRHPALAEFLKEKRITGEVVPHATPEIVKNKDVYGVLPFHLACLCNSITTVDLDLPQELRGKELSLTDIKKYFIGFSTYKVTKDKAE